MAAFSTFWSPIGPTQVWIWTSCASKSRNDPRLLVIEVSPKRANHYLTLMRRTSKSTLELDLSVTHWTLSGDRKHAEPGSPCATLCQVCRGRRAVLPGSVGDAPLALYYLDAARSISIFGADVRQMDKILRWSALHLDILVQIHAR